MKKIITNSKSGQIDTDSNSQITLDIITDQSDATLSLGGYKINYNSLDNLPVINDVTVAGVHNGEYYGLVDAVEGKGLSTNDFTNELKNKLDEIEDGAEVNVQADWNETNELADDFIKNKPTKVTDFLNDADYATKNDVSTSVSTHNTNSSAHSDIRTLISNEETRASNAEERLDERITTLDQGLDERISGFVNTETERATHVEEELQSSISNEETRASRVEGDLNNLSTANKTNLVSAINSEVSRAKNVEGNLNDLSTSVKTNLVAAYNEEVRRAKDAENNLNTAITNETNRASGVEGNLSNLTTSDKTNLVNAINSEKTRATNKETNLQSQINLNASNISNEISNREQAINNLANVYVPKERKINGKKLESDITLTASDVNALPNSTVIGTATISILKNTAPVGSFKLNDTSNKSINIPVPEKTSQLTNDMQFTTEAVVKRIAGNVVNEKVVEIFGDLDGKITNEATIRESADNNLQAQIDAITVSSDVRDIVETYADLTSYDKSKLINGDIIKVLRDETEDDKTTYYKYVKATDNFDLIGSEGPYYTVSDANNTFVPQTRTINSYGLDEDVTLTYEDVGALSESTTIEDLTTQGQQDALNSGITSQLVTQIGTNETDISNINTTLGTYGDIITHDVSEFATASQGSKADTALQPNSPITAGTHTKITYDSNGLVTGGTDLQASDIPTIPVTKIDGLTVNASELNVLDGVDVLTSEINYLKGVTSDIQTQLDNKVIKNSNITGSTKTKITYDSKGLVTGGADLEASDIPSLTLGKISDITVSAASINALDGIDTSTTVQTQINAKQDALVSGENIKTINGSSVLGSGNLNIDALPSQTGHTGQFLTTDGSDASWADVDALPSQSGNAGKLLTTDGTDASWMAKDYYRSLSETQATTLLNNGTYNGEEVQDGEIFNCANGSVKEYEFHYDTASVIASSYSGSPYNDIQDICVTDDGTLYGLPKRALTFLYKSTDKGKTWTTLNVSRTNSTVSDNNAIVYDNGTIYILCNYTIRRGGLEILADYSDVYVDVWTGGEDNQTWNRYYCFHNSENRGDGALSKARLVVTENSLIWHHQYYWGGANSWMRASKSDLETWINIGGYGSDPLFYNGTSLQTKYYYSTDDGDNWSNNGLNVAFVRNGKFYGVGSGKLYTAQEATVTEIGSMTLSGSTMSPNNIWAFDSSTSTFFAITNITDVVSSADGLDWEVVNSGDFTAYNVKFIIPVEDNAFVEVSSDIGYVQGSLEATPVREMIPLSYNKDEVDTALSGKQDTLPSQTGHTGEFLKAGSDGLEWDSVDALPSQTSQSGKFLTTNGTTASWAEITTSESVEDLTDVDLTSVSNGQVLIYDSSDSKWKNGTLTGVSFTKITETLYSASWSNKSYSLTVPGVTNNSMIWVQPSYSASGNNELEYAISNIRGVSQSADTIVFACVETPTRDVNIDIIIS